MSAPNPFPHFPVEAPATLSPSPEVRRGRNGHIHKSRSRATTFPRKRAVTACDTCRWKKTKCGNERPVCASCAKNNWPCSFDPRLDHASFDPASLLILDKLNQTLEKLAEVERGVKGKVHNEKACSCTAGNDLRSAVLTTATATSSPDFGLSSRLSNVTSSSSSSDCLEVPTAFGSAETILTWPIFHSRWPRNFLSQELLIGSLSSQHDSNQRKQFKRASHGINEENVPSLVDRFLQLVHSKNPVFYTSHIREATRQVAEDGVGWDASSCIVLLACALGAVARPFNPSSEAALLSGRTSLDDDAFDLETGDAYYQVARKRLGLLDPSIMAGQCHMLSGIYLMYTLRPLEAWSAFHQAGSAHSLYLRSQAALQERNDGLEVSSSQLEERLEQRLYWTVLKSECEIRVQLDLPQSDLCKLDYPFLFPSPPTPASPDGSSEDHLHTQGSASAASTPSQLLSLASTCGSQSAEEQTWFYYLSEIALRRIENRILNAFYKEDPQHWVEMDLAVMISTAQEIEAQMETWYASLPTSIRFDSDQQASDELRYATQGRTTGIRSLLYRPFLYYAIHAPNKVHPRWNLATTLQGFVQNSLAVCLACNDGHALTHRHHGTWYALRESITAALMLLAAHAADLITVDCLQEYTHSLQICIERLRYWEAEASPDIARARGIIEELMGDSMNDGN